MLHQDRRDIELPGHAEVQQALQRDATARRIMAKGLTPAHGALVGSRLNLNVLKNTGIAVNTVHAATNKAGYRQNKGFWNGEVLTYAPVVQLSNAYFNVHQKRRDMIASGAAAKSPMASVDGNLDSQSPWQFDGIEIRFNPRDVRLFVDMDNRPIHFAEHVTIVGHRCYARGEIEYYESECQAPEKCGDSLCAVRFDSPEAFKLVG